MPKILVEGLVWRVEFHNIHIEKLAKATGEDIFFGFVEHIEWRLQEKQEEDEVTVFDDNEEKCKEKNGDQEACLCPINFEPSEIFFECHFVSLFSIQKVEAYPKRCAEIRRSFFQ